jgi:hypothetical protein
MDAPSTHEPQQLPKLDRFGLIGMIVGLAGVTLMWVPVLAPVLGLCAIALFMLSRRASRVADRPLRGRGMAIAGLICGCATLIVGSLLTAILLGIGHGSWDSEGFEAIRVPGEGTLFPEGCDGFEFAYSRYSWGILWTETNRVDTGQLDITLHCEERVYFSAVEGLFIQSRVRPIELLERDCQYGRRYNLLATERGFLIIYVDGDQLKLAAYEHGATALSQLGAITASHGVATHDSFGNRVSTFYAGGKVLVATQRDDAIKILAGRPGEEARELLSVPIPAHTYDPKVHGTFDGPYLFAWTQAVDPPSEQLEGQVAYAFSADGSAIDKLGVVLGYSSEESYNLDLTVLAEPEGASIYAHTDRQIWRQRIDRAGDKVGEPELIVDEAGGVYNFNVARADSGCVIVYTETGSDLKWYSCATKQIRPLGTEYNVRADCAGSTCLYAARNVVRQLEMGE